MCGWVGIADTLRAMMRYGEVSAALMLPCQSAEAPLCLRRCLESAEGPMAVTWAYAGPRPCLGLWVLQDPCLLCSLDRKWEREGYSVMSTSVLPSGEVSSTRAVLSHRKGVAMAHAQIHLVTCTPTHENTHTHTSMPHTHHRQNRKNGAGD